MRPASVLGVAREDVLDNLRQRSVVLTLVFAPLVLWGAFAFLPLVFMSRGESSDANLHSTIAVSQNAPPAARRALARRLRVVVAADPTATVAFDEADAALLFGGDPAADLRSGRPFTLHELTSSSRTKATMTLGIAESALAALQAQRSGVTAPRQHAELVRAVSLDDSRGLISRSAPLLFITALGAIIQLSALRFLSGRSLRTLDGLLVRPIRRTDLLAGLALSSVVVGMISASALLFPFTLLVLAVAHHHGTNGVAATAGILAVVIAATAWFFATLGLALGVSGQSLNAARVRSTAALFVVTAIGLLMELSGTVAHTPLLRALPVTGAMVLLRHAIVGTATVGETAETVVVAAVGGLVCFGYARRYLDSERVVTRA